MRRFVRTAVTAGVAALAISAWADPSAAATKSSEVAAAPTCRVLSSSTSISASCKSWDWVVQYRAYAYCADSTGWTIYVSGSRQTVGSWNTYGPASTATCNAGYHVISGGVST